MRHVKYLGLAATVITMLAAAHAAVAEDVITRNNVSFVSGGVALDSRERLQAQEKNFNLKLIFTLNEGNYLSDVSVRIADPAGKTVIEHVADGPFFMAKLPAGTYTLTASYGDKTQTRKLNVGQGLHTETLRWPGDPQTDTPSPREKSQK